MISLDERPLGRSSAVVALAFTLGILGLAATSAPASAMEPSTASAATAWGPRDLDGVWENPPGQVRTFSGVYGGFEPPLKQEWLDYWRIVQERSRRAQVVWDPGFKCLPPGMPRLIHMSYPVEIVVTKSTVYMLAEYFGETRRIYMDGRTFPTWDELEPSFTGYSIGRWEDDTLVVETRGLRWDSLLDRSLIPHSDQLRIIEKWRRTGENELSFSITAIDPVVLDVPEWTNERKAIRVPPDYMIREFVCADREIIDKFEPTSEDDFYGNPNPKLKTLP